MDKAVERVLRAFEKRGEKEGERIRRMNMSQMQEHLDEFLLSIGPATEQLLNLLAKQSEAKTVLEVGSSYGYSTAWLAEAARQNRGTVISLEIHSGKQGHARSSVKKSGLDGFVDFRSGDARDLLAKMKGKVDFVILDLWKNLYIPCFDLFYPKLSAGAVVVADKMTYPESARKHAEAYRKHIRKKPGIQSVLLYVGSGLELTRYK
jgi:predicted O-methyltransferase YrrM